MELLQSSPPQQRQNSTRGLCAATLPFNSDWALVPQLQVDRERTSQFYLTDYAVHFRWAYCTHL